MTKYRYALITILATFAVLVTACVPPAPPAPLARQAPPTTTTLPARTTPTPGYVSFNYRAQVAYNVTFFNGVPNHVRAEILHAATQAAAASGITLTSTGPASTGNGPLNGEIRVRLGSLCNVEHEAGCAVVWAAGNTIWGTDLSISTAGAAHASLRDFALHEIGHALGLDHVNINPAIHLPQIMGNPHGVFLGAYQTGDLAGLASVGTTVTRGNTSAAEDPTVVYQHTVAAGGTHHDH